MKTPPEEWVYVGNLPFATTEEDIRKVFEPVAEIKEIDMCLDEVSKHFRGFAYIHFNTPADAQKVADTLNNQLVGERAIHIMRYDQAILEAQKGHD